MATIKVKSNVAPREDGSGEVILWAGDVFITSAPNGKGQQITHTVESTPEIQGMIAAGRLIEVKPTAKEG